MVGRPRKNLTEQDFLELYEYLKELDFLRVKEKKCLQMIYDFDFKNWTPEQLKLARETQYLMNRAIKNFDLLHEIQLREKHSSTEKQILELAEKSDIDSYFSMHDLLDALRKKTDATFAENKIKQKIKAQSKEKSPKQIADHKKYFLGDLLQKWMNSRYSNLEDDQVLEALKQMIENERIGTVARKLWTEKKENLEWINNRIAETHELKEKINLAKSDPRNPFKTEN